ncbi:MAG: RsmE family RNA methyltransferase [Victivallaceae bacterium]|nr:RsmE family RNA methyltransferase [Victivallaceae bacterium]
MIVHTVFLSPMPETGTVFELPREEAEHLFKVFRASVGDAVEVLDGAGHRGRAVVVAPKRLQMGQVEFLPPPDKEIRLYCALPRRNKQDDLLKQATELGVTAIHPVRCRRSVAQSEPTPRWEVLVREACKQSKNPYLPQLAEPQDFADALHDAARRRLTLVYGSIVPAEKTAFADSRGVAYFVGPEGGFAPEEFSLLERSGAVGVNLGPYVLRLETAAVAGIAVLRKFLMLLMILFVFAGCEKDVTQSGYMTKGRDYCNKGDFLLAEKFFRYAALKYPAAPEPAFALAALYEESLDEPYGAVYFYRQGLKHLPPDHVDRPVYEAACRRLEAEIAASSPAPADPTLLAELEKYKKESTQMRQLVQRQQWTVSALRRELDAAKQPEKKVAAEAKTYTVRPGDTLSVIARRCRVSQAELQRVNQLSDKSVLQIGDVLILPEK